MDGSVWEGRMSLRLLAFNALMGFLSFLVSAMMIVVFDRFINIHSLFKIEMWQVVVGLFVILFFTTSFNLLIDYLKILSKKYYLTSERLVIETGILTERKENVELYRVNDIIYTQNFIYKVLKIGTILLKTVDTTSPNIEIRGISNSEEVHELLRKNIEKMREKRLIETNLMDKGIS